MKKVTLIIATTCALFSSVAFADEKKYLCIADKAVGFSFNLNSKVWESKTFTTDSKYIISKPNPDADTAFFIHEFGDARHFPLFRCVEEFNDYGFLNCEGLGGNLTFKKTNLRFITTNFGSYFVTPPGEWRDTPFMKIGKCSRF